MGYSVLMPVCCKEKPEHLRESMESIFAQTVPTDDFVLVCDGPLGDGLNGVVASMQRRFSHCLNVVRLEKNVGLGNALNEGLRHCKNGLVARMDSDDIAREDRCQRQLAVFSAHPEVSIVSGVVEEFAVTPKAVIARRIPPETQAEILAFSKKRNPFNHPCVMYRKSAVQAAGGYQDFYLLEDYFLWLRMLLDGAVGYNIQAPLLWMRAGKALYRRRSGLVYSYSQLRLLAFMKRHRFIALRDLVGFSFVRTVVSMAPNPVRMAFYLRVLRDNA